MAWPHRRAHRPSNRRSSEQLDGQPGSQLTAGQLTAGQLTASQPTADPRPLVLKCEALPTWLGRALRHAPPASSLGRGRQLALAGA